MNRFNKPIFRELDLINFRQFALEKSHFILLLVAFAARLYKISSIPASLDEVLTIGFCVPQPLAQILWCETRFHPLASALAHLYAPHADHLFLMRWPAVVVGMISLLVAYRLAVDLFGQKIGWLALFLLAFSPIHLNYSVVVRGYVGLMATTCLSLIFLRRALLHDGWRHWLGFVLVNFCGIYFHLYSVLALVSQIALIGLWYLSGHQFLLLRQPAIYWSRFGYRLAKPLTSLLVLGLLYTPVVYGLYRYTVQVIEGESRWQDDFWHWRDGVFSLQEDLTPFYRMIAMMGPISVEGIGTYFYFAFWLIAIVVLWRRRHDLALATTVCFTLPFLTIFIAMLNLGYTFLTFSRYLIFMLPLYLIVVAVGLGAAFTWLGSWRNSSKDLYRLLGWGAGLTLLVVWLGLVGLSTRWYFQRSAAVDWYQLANLLHERLQAQDIVICEERARGFQEPDRAKPYCMWMLNTHLPALEPYTPRFQSAIDFVANHDYLQSQRSQVMKPGGVWLILWQKIILDTSTFYGITAEIPSLLPPLDASELSAYPVWRFGAATLVYINSEDTLLENIQQTAQLLLRLEDRPADKARYYRSLAEIEATQGRKIKAEAFLEQSQTSLAQTSYAYWGLLDETRQIIGRIPASTSPPKTAQVVGARVGDSLCLQAYALSPPRVEAGQTLNLDLYWRVLDVMNEDYTFFLEMAEEDGSFSSYLEFEPFDRMYPTPWWWPGQQILEQRRFPIPADFPIGNYVVKFGGYDKAGELRPEPISLFRMASQEKSSESSPWTFEGISSSPSICP